MIIKKTIRLCILLVIISSSFHINAQSSDSTLYPYRLPLWGQKVQDQGMAHQLQLPVGVNVNYVNAYADIDITEFELLFGDLDLTGIINPETLNFTEVNATTNGSNFRADVWLLPFMNVYGLFSVVKGGTNVSLQPTWKNSVGEIILQLPEFSSEVKFDAIAYGCGTTMIFGWGSYFSSIDLNYSRTKTELLQEQVGYLTFSGRLGYRFLLSKTNKDIFVAPYAGIMYRDFVGAKGSSGNIGMDDVFPGLDETFNTNVNTKIDENQAIIDDPSTPIAERIKLQAQNQTLRNIQEKVNNSGIFSTEINYFIKKELVQNITFQFGFNMQITKNLMIRGEYGIADSQRFLLSGIQYRFGIRKKSVSK